MKINYLLVCLNTLRALQNIFAPIRYSVGLLLFVCVIAIGARGQTSVNPSQPGSENPGAPDGSYLLSDFETVNLYSGKAYFNLPLLKVAGRGGVSHTISLPIKPRDWFLVTSPIGGLIPLTDFKPSDHFLPGRMVLRSGSDDLGTGNYTNILTRFVYTASDGSEYEFIDKLTGGKPYTSIGQLPRGSEFVSQDGTGMTFLTDSPIFDTLNNEVGASGFLMLPDGTRYRFDGGNISWIRDRNGNKISFTYIAAPYTPNPGESGWVTSTITDSLNRQIRFEYDVQDIAPYGKCDRIIFRGFGGAERIIRISKSTLGSSLRAGFALQPFSTLFPEYSLGSDLFDCEIISAVWLPNGLSYRLRYTPYAELARIELPTGGAIEYDFGSTWDSVSLNLMWHRLVQRRTYKPELESKTTYSSVFTLASPASDSTRTVTVDNFIPGSPDVRLNREKHYFFSPWANTGIPWQPGGYRPWKEGLEYQVESFGADATTLLKRVTTTWQQRQGVSWWPLAGTSYPNGTNAAYEPANGTRVSELKTEITDVVPSLISKQTFGYDDTVPFNNRSHLYEYDFGAGGPGGLLRHTVTEFVTSATYTSATGNAHIRNLPSKISIFDGQAIERARTTFEYDNYTADAGNHVALLPRTSISGLDPAFTSSYTTRGNTTATTQHFFDSLGGVTGSISTYTHYDVAGNDIKAIDARGFATTLDFSDCFGAPDGNATLHSAPLELSSVGQASYAFPTVVTNAANHITRSQFDYYLGRAIDTQDANGIFVANYFDDLLDRPKKVIRGFGTSVQNQTTYSYDDVGHIITTARDLNSSTDGLLVTKLVYDGLGRTKENRQYEGGTNYIVVLTEYDSMGRALRQSNPFRPWNLETAVWTTTSYDALSRVISTARPDNSVVSIAYSANRALVTDEAGKNRISVTDALGRLKEVWEITAADSATEPVTFSGSGGVAAGYLTKYEYDVFNDLITVTQRMGASGTLQSRSFVYDSLQNLTSATNPESGTTNYQYDNNGNLLVKTDARGVSIHHEYDELNRLKRRWYNGSSSVSAATHNSPVLPSGVGATDEMKLYYDAQVLPSGAPAYSRGAATGRVVAQLYGTGSNGDYFAYNALGQQTLKIQQTGTVDYQMSAAYNLAGARTSTTYPSGRTISNTFDEAGRLTSVGGNLGDGTNRTYANEIIYSSFGPLAKEKFGTNTVIYNKLFYNKRGQLAEIRESTSYTGPTDYSADRGAIINNFSDQCTGICSGSSMTDNNGNLKKQEIHIPNQQMRWQQYEYDPLNRLKSVREVLDGGAEQWKQQFTYDRWGNRTIDNAVTYGTGINNKAFTVDASKNRLGVGSGQSGAMTYDDAGNLINDTYTGRGNRTYDAENKITSAVGSNDQVQTYNYDSSGQRIKRTVDGVQTWQIYGFGGELVAEYAASGAVLSPQREYGYRNRQLLITTETGSFGAASPTGLAATPPTSGSNITLSWSQASGATNYRVERKAAGQNFTLKGTTSSLTLLDSNTTAGNAYLYRVCAADGAGNCTSNFSNIALGTATTFSDPTIVSIVDDPSGATVTPVRAAHVNELRAAVIAVRNLAGGLPAVTWTYQNASGQLAPGDQIHVQDVRELRTHLDGALSALGIDMTPYTDPTLTGFLENPSNATLIRAVHFRELRLRVRSGIGAAPAGGGPSFRIYWLVTDQLGTPRMLIDQTGNLANMKRHDYLPFGEELLAPTGGRGPEQGYASGDGVRQQFTSKERDSETGLDYFLARYRSPIQGRFLSVDPDNTGADLNLPQTWNAYAYVVNNPLVLTDPDGLKVIICDMNGACTTLSDEEANKYTFNRDYQRKNGFYVMKGKIYDFDGNQIGTYQNTCCDWLAGTPNERVMQELQDDRTWERAAVSAVWNYTFGRILRAIFGGRQPAKPSAPAPSKGPGAAGRLQYEASPKHTQTARGNVSAAPRNGQDALDYSVQVKTTSPRRVGIDYATGEFVIFDRTLGDTYHGHVRTWDQLEQTMRNALIKSGMTDSRGNIQ